MKKRLSLWGVFIGIIFVSVPQSAHALFPCYPPEVGMWIAGGWRCIFIPPWEEEEFLTPASDVSIILIEADNLAVVPIVSTPSDTGGAFSINEIPAGTYNVEVDGVPPVTKLRFSFEAPPTAEAEIIVKPLADRVLLARRSANRLEITFTGPAEENYLKGIAEGFRSLAEGDPVEFSKPVVPTLKWLKWGQIKQHACCK